MSGYASRSFIIVPHVMKPRRAEIECLAQKIQALAHQYAKAETHTVQGPCLEHCYNELESIEPRNPDYHGGLSEEQLVQKLEEIEKKIPPPVPDIPAFPISGLGHTVLTTCTVDGKPAYNIDWEYESVKLIRLRYTVDPKELKLVQYMMHQSDATVMQAIKLLYQSVPQDKFEAACQQWFDEFEIEHTESTLREIIHAAVVGSDFEIDKELLDTAIDRAESAQNQVMFFLPQKMKGRVTQKRVQMLISDANGQENQLGMQIVIDDDIVSFIDTEKNKEIARTFIVSESATSQGMFYNILDDVTTALVPPKPRYIERFKKQAKREFDQIRNAFCDFCA